MVYHFHVLSSEFDLFCSYSVAWERYPSSIHFCHLISFLVLKMNHSFKSQKLWRFHVPLQGISEFLSLLLSWHRGIHCMCLYWPWTIHVAFLLYSTGINYIVVTSKANFCNIFMERVETVIFSVGLHEQQCIHFWLSYLWKTTRKCV